MKRLFTLWRTRPWLTSAFLLACGLTLFFAFRLTVHTVYWAAHRDEPIRPWMTVGYVARSWGLDAREVDALAGLPLPEMTGHPQPFSEIAAERGVPVSEIIGDVEAAVQALRQREGSGE